MKLEVGVNLLHNTEDVYVVKFTRIQGDAAKYNEISNQLLNKILEGVNHEGSTDTRSHPFR